MERNINNLNKNLTQRKNVPEIILSIDPGASKTGFAVVHLSGEVIERKIIPSESLQHEINACFKIHKPDIIILGDGTSSKKAKTQAEQAEEGVPILLVNEKHSTERARLRYFLENPPKGLWKLIPITMQTPPEPYDDYAAVILAEDFISTISNRIL